MPRYSFIDLFAGCGGLTEGFYKKGYIPLAHVEWDHTACETLKERMKYYKFKNAEDSVLEADITDDNIVNRIDSIVNGAQVDVIIGGPPCQAYSSLGRAKDENAMEEDPRNFLFESYVKILNHYMPKVFVFENVTGILTAHVKGKKIIDLVIKELSRNYNVDFDPDMVVLNSADYGVPQIRKRVIIIGVRNDIQQITPREIYNAIKKTHYDPLEELPHKKGMKKYITVRQAIGELPAVEPGEGKKNIDFISNRDNSFLRRIVKRNYTGLMDHVARKHNDIDREIYRTMAARLLTYQELLELRPDLKPENPRVFGNSYTVQFWDRPSRTIIAHLYKDGNQFIHPDYMQARTLTVREAARLQSFPDDFVFCGSRTDQFKQIGNAVPPLLSEAIAKAIKTKLNEL